MSSSSSALAHVGDGRDGVRLRAPIDRERRVARQLRRFAPRHRAAVARLAARDVRLADLSLSFPALLFALAVPRPGFAPEPVISLVLAGVPLKRLARLAGLPMWSRRLMPEAFVEPIAGLPDGERIACRIVNDLPRSPKLAARWLAAVSFMARHGTDEAVVWIARELARDAKAVADKRLALIALYAWFSASPSSRAGALIVGPWQSTMAWATALGHASAWLERVSLHAYLDGRPVTDTWLRPGAFEGIEFRPLCSAVEIDEEAEAMRHCVRTYADAVALNRCRLWSVRRAGVRLATLEIGVGRYRGPLASVWQMQGVANTGVDRAVWATVQRWLNSHDLAALQPSIGDWATFAPGRATWLAMWRPYWLAKRRIPEWLPLSPTAQALQNL